MTRNRKNNELINATLITAKKVLREAARKHFLGRGSPENTLRYYIKIGLLPHMERQQARPGLAFTEGFLPAYTLELLKVISHLKKEGKGLAEIKAKAAEIREKFEAPAAAASVPSSRSLAYAPALAAFSIFLLLGFFISPWTAKLREQALALGAKKLASLVGPYLRIPPKISVPQKEEGQIAGQMTSPLLAWGGEEGENMLINPSFEMDTVSGNPRGWSRISQSSATDTAPSGESVRSGTLALKFEESNCPYFTCQLGISQPLAQTVNGRNYTLSVWVRTKNLLGNPKLRLGFFGAASKDDPNYRLGLKNWEEYAADKYEDFSLTGEPSKDWVQFSFTDENAVLDKYPIVQILDYQGGKIFFDDLAMVETVPSTTSEVSLAAASGNSSTSEVYRLLFSQEENRLLGLGSVVAQSDGTLRSAHATGGSLGTPDYPFSALYLGSANIDQNGNFYIKGGQTVEGTSTFHSPAEFTAGVDLGNESTDIVTVLGRFDSSLLPTATTTYDFGSSSLRWQKLWAQDADFSNDVNITDALSIGGSLMVKGTTLATTGNIETSGNLTVYGNSTFGDATSDTLTVNGATTINLPDNTADALDIQQGTNNYINIATTNAGETLTLGSTAIYPNINLYSALTSITDGTYTATFVQDEAGKFQDGTNTVKMANGTYAIDAAGNIRIIGGFAASGGAVSLNTGTSTGTISLGNSSAGTLTLTSGGAINTSAGAASSANITGTFLINSTDTLSLNTTNNGAITTGTGLTTLGGNLNVNGGTIATSQTAANLFNTTAATLNIGGAATSLNLGAAGGAATIANAVTALAGVLNVNGAGASYFAGNVGIGTSNPAYKLDVSGSGRFTQQIIADYLPNSTTQATIYAKPTVTLPSQKWFYDGSSWSSDGNMMGDTNDYKYYGYSYKFTGLYLAFSPAGVGYNLTAEYSKGLNSWASLTITDDTSNLTGNNNLYFAPPSDWATDTVNSAGPYYWVRIKTTNPPTIQAIANKEYILPAGYAFATYLSSEDTTPKFYVDYRGNVQVTTLLVAKDLQVLGNLISNLIPKSSTAYDLGSSGLYWNRAYIDTVNANNIVATDTEIGGTKVEDFIINSNNPTADTQNMGLNFERGTSTPNAVFGWDATNKDFTLNSSLTLSSGIETANITLPGDLNTTVGAIQTNSIARIDNAGNLTNIGTYTSTLTKSTGDVDLWNGTLTNNTASGTQRGMVLNVAGSGATENGLLISQSGAGTAANALEVSGTWTNGLIIGANAGNVGIGTSNPVNALTVSGNADITGNLGIGNTSPTYKLDVAGGANLSSGNDYYINGTSVLNATTLGSGVVSSSLTSVGALASGSIATGFGTITTANTITGTTINGTTGINTGAGAGTQRTDSSGNLLNIGNLTLSGAISGGTAYSGSGNITSTAGLLTISGTGNSSFAGNVGIGTTGPISKLMVQGAAIGKALVIFDETGDQALLTASASGVTKFLIDHGGNVGIGTTNPSAPLSVGASSQFQVSSTGNVTGGTYNKVTITAPAAGSTLTIADGKTLTSNASITLAGTDGSQLSLAGNLTTSGAYATTLTTTNTTSVTLPISGTLVSSVTTGNGVSATNTAGALAFTLGAITPTTVNGLTLQANAIGFQIAGGTTPKTLTVSGDTTVSGSNTGDSAANSSTMYIGTTAHALNRASAAEGLAGITGLTPNADFTLTQNSVAALTSVESGAIVNTLYLKAGNVGIGMTSPSYKLDVNGTSNFAGAMTFTATNTYDIGTNATTLAPRTVYAGTSVVAPTINATTALQLNGTTVLSGTTLGSTIVSSSLTSIGTLASGAVPASLVTAGTFGTGAYTMDTSLTNPLFIGGTLAGSNITYKSTTGTGTTTGIAHQFVGGTNGGTVAMTILNNGNVGIGTTSPAAGNKLHVEGQCVTGDSLLPIVKSKETDRDSVASLPEINRNSLKDNEFQQISYVPIKDIKGGEQVLSLDEQTGKIVPAKIKGLLDMGIKPIYKLTTEDGRTIRTTGNHPYLTQDGWQKVVYLEEGEEIAVVKENLFAGSGEAGNGFFAESDPSQKENHHKQTSDNQNIGIDSPKTSSVHNSAVFLSLTAQYINNVPAIKSYVKTPKSAPVLGGEKLGTITTMPNHPADKLINKSAIDLNQTGSNFFIKTNSSIPEKDLSTSGIVWGKIASIEYVGEEQVYDIEVEGTHNFIANGILAHNTYISGNVGIGTTGPGAMLHIDKSQDGSTNLAITNGSNASGARSYILVGQSLTGQNYAFYEHLGTGYTADGLRIADRTVFMGADTQGLAILTAQSAPLIFATGGWAESNERMRITSTGNVGIGTTGPQSLLHLYTASGNITPRIETKSAGYSLLDFYGSQTTDTTIGGIRMYNSLDSIAAIYAQRDGANDAAALIFETQKTGDTSTERMRITSAGNVGIGTTGPVAKLDVRGTLYSSSFPANQFLYDTASFAQNVGGGIGFGGKYNTAGNLNTYAVVQGVKENATDGNYAGALRFLTSANGGSSVTEQMRITSSGNVGIGTTNPGAKLEVSGQLRISGYESYAGDTVALVIANTGASGTARIYMNGATNLPNYTVIQDNSVTKWSYGYGGSGITPNGSFFFSRSTYAASDLVITSGGNVGIGTANPGTAGLAIMSGNVGIGTTGPSQKLDVAGSINLTGGIAGGTTYSGSGNITSTAGALNIGTVQTEAKGIGVYHTTGVSTNYRAYSGRTTIGNGVDTVEGIYSRQDYGGTGSANSGRLFYSFATLSDTGTTTSLKNFEADVLFYGNRTITDNYLFLGNVRVNTSITGNITNLYGLRLNAPSGAGTVNITNQYGIYLENQNAGSSNAYAILTNAGKVVFNEGGDASTDLRIEGDTDANLFFTDASVDAVGIGYGDLTGTTGKLAINGNVGIGTTGPTSPLHIYKNTNGANDMRIENPNTGTGAYASIATKNDLGNLYVQAVGSGFNLVPGLAGKGVIGIDPTLVGMVMYTQANQDLEFQLGAIGTTDVIFKSSGNVGIGTTGPLAKLDVNGSAWLRGVAGGTGGLFATTGGNIGIGTTGPVNALTISGNANITGNLGIGNTAPTSMLFVQGAVVGKALVVFDETGDQAPLTASASGVTKFLVDHSGNVGIGTTNPARKLEVVGDMRLGTLLTGAGSAIYWGANGDLVDSASSLRFKDNITDFGPVLDKLNRLRPVKFTWNQNSNSPGIADFGLIAEEVNQTLPDLVIYEKDQQTPYGIKYEKLGLLAISGLQEQELKLDQIGDIISTQNLTISEGDAEISQTREILTLLTRDIDSLKTSSATASSRLDSLEASQAELTQQFKDELALINAGMGVASASAQLNSEIPLLTVQEATVSGNLMVLGKTTLADVGITGKVTIGLLTIDGLSSTPGESTSNTPGVTGTGSPGVDEAGASISTLSGPLKLQDLALGNLEIMAGKVTVDTKGNLQISGDLAVKGEIKARKINIDLENQTVISAGKVEIPVGQTETEVETTALTEKSLIFATPENLPVAVSASRSAETSFTIQLEKPIDDILKVSWWIVN